MKSDQNFSNFLIRPLKFDDHLRLILNLKICMKIRKQQQR